MKFCQNGGHYYGQFESNIFKGYGILTVPGVGSYRGEFGLDYPFNYGHMKHENNDEYIGKFIDSLCLGANKGT